MRRLTCPLVLLVAIAGGSLRLDSAASAQGDVSPPAPALVEEVSRLVTRHFYDREVVRDVWRDARAVHTTGLSADATSEEVAAALDGMLEDLGASHTGHYTPDELAYYELVDIFARGDLGRRLRALFDDGRIAYTGIGVVPRRVAGRTFLAAVYHGGPADDAGLMVGDESLSADGGPFGRGRVRRGRAARGAGIMPDREVPFRLPYAAGDDPQLDAALAELARAISEAESAPADPL